MNEAWFTLRLQRWLPNQRESSHLSCARFQNVPCAVVLAALTSMRAVEVTIVGTVLSLRIRRPPMSVSH